MTDFTIADWRKLGEALERLNSEGASVASHAADDGLGVALHLVMKAARQTYDRWQECDTCEGDGRELDDDSARALAKAVGFSGPEELDNGPCPSCGGSGLQPNQDDSWRENAKRWRDLYLETTIEHGIGHTGETVQVEGQFRKLAAVSFARLAAVRAFDKECETCNGRREIKVLEGSVFGGTSQCPDCTDDLEPPPTYNGIL